MNVPRAMQLVSIQDRIHAHDLYFYAVLPERTEV